VTKASAFWSSTRRSAAVLLVVGCLVFGFLWQVMILAGIVLSVQVWRPSFFVGGCRLALMESLILAQDERWRRA
jgi:hypothetical protein